MARARNIKPAFFLNEVLAELPMAGRLLFIGLWTLADKEGRLEYRPKKIKVEVFPYDSVQIEKLLEDLRHANFIKIYGSDDRKLIEVVNFKKHQNPHKNEKASELPSSENFKENNNNVIGQEISSNYESGTDKTGSAHVITPDSGFLIPDSLNLIPEGNTTVPQAEPDPVVDVFEHWRKAMNHPRARLDDKRRKVIRRALKDGYSVEDLKKAVTGCAQTPHNMGKNERGQRYDGLELILRNGDQIDRFMANATTDNPCSGGAI